MLTGSQTGVHDTAYANSGAAPEGPPSGRAESLSAASTRTQQRRLFMLAVIMVTVVATAASVSLALLYRSELARQSEFLQELALGEARLTEAVISASEGPHEIHTVSDSTLMKLAHAAARRSPKAKFGRSGEFLLARRLDDRIVVLRRGETSVTDSRFSIPLQSQMAVPIRLALRGQSGILAAEDYAGTKVLAAYAPIPGHGVGVVAKVDLAEILDPLLPIGVITAGGLIVFLILVIGGWRRISVSMIQRDRTAAALRQSEARLSSAQRIANLGGWQYNFHKKEFSATDEAYRLFAVPTGQVRDIVRALFKAIHPDDRAEVRQVRRSAFKENRDYEVEYRIIRPDGVTRYIHEQGSFQFDARGARLRLSGALHDVTERRQSEEKLRQQAQIFDQIHDAVVYMDPKGVILSWNKGAELQSGYSAEEAIGNPIDFIIAPQDKDRFWKEVAPAIASSGSGEFDLWLSHRSGTCYRGHTSYDVVRNPKGRIVGIIACNLDVTEKFRIEEALRTSEERLAGILRMAPEAVITVDTEQRITLFSNSATRIFGYDADEVIGQPLDILLPEAHRQHHGALVRDFADSTANQLDLNKQRDVSGRRKDGSVFPALASVSKLHLPNETVLTVLLHDISERKKEEMALIEAKHQAEIANRTKSEFLAHMSHELRTPLNAILGFSQMLMAEMLPKDDIDRVQEYASDIFESGTHLLAVISDLLDLAKIESGHMDLEEVEVDISDIIATSLRQVDARARNADLKLIYDASADVPNLWADERKLKQVILNLLSNAVKFTPKDGEIEVKAGQLDDGRMALSVRDTGDGMTAQEVELALQPFGQIDNAMTRDHEGTGLGLPLSQSLCQLHGGELAITSSKGVGTTVSVYLPRERVLSEKAAAMATNNAVGVN